MRPTEIPRAYVGIKPALCTRVTNLIKTEGKTPLTKSRKLVINTDQFCEYFKACIKRSVVERLVAVICKTRLFLFTFHGNGVRPFIVGIPFYIG